MGARWPLVSVDRCASLVPLWPLLFQFAQFCSVVPLFLTDTLRPLVSRRPPGAPALRASGACLRALTQRDGHTETVICPSTVSETVMSVACARTEGLRERAETGPQGLPEAGARARGQPSGVGHPRAPYLFVCK